MNTRARRRGFSLVEIMIALAVMAVVLGATYAVLSASLQGDDALRARVDMQLEATNALKQVTALLKESGSPPAGDPNGIYPQIYQLGNAQIASAVKSDVGTPSGVPSLVSPDSPAHFSRPRTHGEGPTHTISTRSPARSGWMASTSVCSCSP